VLSERQRDQPLQLVGRDTVVGQAIAGAIAERDGEEVSGADETGPGWRGREYTVAPAGSRWRRAEAAAERLERWGEQIRLSP
jgi:hypothetical protein